MSEGEGILVKVSCGKGAICTATIKEFVNVWYFNRILGSVPSCYKVICMSKVPSFEILGSCLLHIKIIISMDELAKATNSMDIIGLLFPRLCGKTKS